MKKCRLSIIMAVFAFIAMLPLQAFAAEIKEPGVTCTPVDDNMTGYSVDLYVPNAAKEEISTLGLKLDVTPAESISGYGSVIEFSDDVKTRAKVYEYRSGNTLNIYLAGTESLFNEDDTLHIGKVSMKNEAGESISLKEVKLDSAEDALMVVRGWDSEAVDMENWIDDPGTDEPAGPDIPDHPENPDDPGNSENPDIEDQSKFEGTDSKEITVSSKSDETLIAKSVLAYLKENYAEQLKELGEDYQVVSRLNLVSMSEADVQQKVKDAFATLLTDGKKIGQYYEISITADVQKDGKVVEGLSNILITQLEDKIKVNLNIPKDLQKSGRTFEMFHYMPDEKAEILKSTLGDNKISFWTDSFSPYALAYTDQAGGASGVSGTDNSRKSAQTGDEANMMLYLMLGILSGGIAVFSMKRKAAHRS